MFETGKSLHEQFESQDPHHSKTTADAGTVTAHATSELDATGVLDAMGALKDAAASIHESRIRAADQVAIGNPAGLPNPSFGNPIFAMAKSLVMQDSAVPQPQAARTQSARA
jgi:hypothetical protein